LTHPTVSLEVFERWVEETLRALPAFFRQRIDNVLFVVEDVPAPEVQRLHPGRLLGLYHGIPVPQRSLWHEGPTFPDEITLYKKNIEAVCRDEDELKRQIQQTVLHELGHYFGMDEAQMDAVEATWRKTSG